MARGKTKPVGLKTGPTDHTALASFEPFKGRHISSVADLAKLMEEFGFYRIYIRGPNSRMRSSDTREAEVGSWEVGVKLNTFAVDYQRSGGCSTLEEALQKALGVTVGQVPVGPEIDVEDDGELLV